MPGKFSTSILNEVSFVKISVRGKEREEKEMDSGVLNLPIARRIRRGVCK